MKSSWAQQQSAAMICCYLSLEEAIGLSKRLPTYGIVFYVISKDNSIFLILSGMTISNMLDQNLALAQPKKMNQSVQGFHPLLILSTLLVKNMQRWLVVNLHGIASLHDFPPYMIFCLAHPENMSTGCWGFVRAWGLPGFEIWFSP